MKTQKILMLGLFCLLAFMGIGAEVEPEVKKSFLSSVFEWNNVVNILLGVLALFGATITGYWVLAKKKIRQAGELLIKFADSVDDNKIDANERTDLSQAARNLLSK